MDRRFLAVLAISITAGIMVGVPLGPLAGLGVFAFAALAGTAPAVLWRRQLERKALERRLARVAVHRVIGDGLRRPPS